MPVTTTGPSVTRTAGGAIPRPRLRPGPALRHQRPTELPAPLARPPVTVGRVSEGNVAIVREMFAAWNRGDYERAQTAIDPAVVAVMETGTDFDGTYEGLEGMQRLMRSFWGAFSEFHSDIEEAIAAGDEVFTTLRHHGRGKASGAEVEMTNWQVFTLRDGRIVRYRIYGDRERALDAAGIPAPD